VNEEQSNAHVLPAVILGGLLAFGMTTGGLLLGTRLRDFKRADRYVEVKGLVERTVKSDSATWPISFSEAGDALPAVFAASEKDKAAVMSFLAAKGFGDPEITLGSIAVTDRSTEQYNNDSKGPRFVVQRTITVQSNDVDKVAAANAQTADLIKAGVVVQSGQGQGSGVSYSFNGLNALKPDMITEATKNARESADRFAADSGSQVGAIRDANQGVFSISAANAGSGPGDDDNQYSAEQQAQGSIMKKVRVVATIDYYLSK
jgi:hypothetical protein